MTTKRLYRSTRDRMISGVCGGIAEYFNVDPSIVRIITLIMAVTGGPAILVYIVASVVIPEASAELADKDDTPKGKKTTTTRSTIEDQPVGISTTSIPSQFIWGFFFIAIGVGIMLRSWGWFDTFGWIWHWIGWQELIAAALFALGLTIILRRD